MVAAVFCWAGQGVLLPCGTAQGAGCMGHSAGRITHMTHHAHPPCVRSKMRADVICSMRWEQRRTPKDLQVMQERMVSVAAAHAAQLPHSRAAK